MKSSMPHDKNAGEHKGADKGHGADYAPIKTTKDNSKSVAKAAANAVKSNPSGS
jgi:hypothetical protein